MELRNNLMLHVVLRRRELSRFWCGGGGAC